MPSYQTGGPSSKFDKLKTLDPLNPLAPFTAQPGEETEVERVVISEQTDQRLSRRLVDRPVAPPSQGAAASHPGQQQQQNPALNQNNKLVTPLQNTRLDLSDRIDHGDGNKGDIGKRADDSDSDDDDYYLEGLDEDPVLAELRQKRLAELKNEHGRREEQLARGHGDYRTISQDEFLPECTSSSKHHVVVHFFHKEFVRCKIMDHHIKLIAPRQITCKFLRIDAEKAPFFVSKLQIKTLPTVIVFLDGKAMERLIGFEGLVSETRDPDEWRTSQLLLWLDSVGAIKYDEDDDPDNNNGDEGALTRRLRKMGLAPSGQRVYDEDL